MKVDIIEHGNIYFFYRPRVGEEEPRGREDVQRFYLVLSPKGEKQHRRMIVGRQQMPDPSQSGTQRMWAFVDMVKDHPKKLVEALQGETYQTKTRGERHQPAARPAGEGVYELVRHDGHTHLAYVLELPKQQGEGEVQQAFRLEQEASYVVSIKNPEQPSPREAGLPEHSEADFPKRLRDNFEGRRFIDIDPPDFLDYEGAEIALIAASEDVRRELGIELEPEEEDSQTAEIFRDLQMRKKEHPVEPLMEGSWQ